MIGMETMIMFGGYLIFLIGVGVYFYRKTAKLEDYLIGGRGMGSWVTALSAQASDMSGWLLMGLPGSIYLFGLRDIWVVIGLLIGTYLNWKYIAPKLRVATEETDTLTLPSFLEKSLNDKTGIIKTLLALGTLFFFTIYSSSGLVATGKLFESMFGINYKVAVMVGTLTIVLYTFLGGYLASCWTDFFQGILMFFAIISVPVVAYFNVGGYETVTPILHAKKDLFNNANFFEIISSLAWGLGYFGQPHILVRFMSIKSVHDLKKSRTIAMTWVIISLVGAVAIGLVGIALFPNISDLGGDSEKIFIHMISKLFNPWTTGLLLAAILSAIMSTIDSQLLVSSTTLTEDFYKVFRKKANEKELLWIGRVCIVIISILALLLALNPNTKVLALVSYAWGGFGVIFGPAIISTLYFKSIDSRSVISGVAIGILTFILWKVFNLDSFIYELLPGFIANFVTIYVVQHVFINTKKEVLE